MGKFCYGCMKEKIQSPYCEHCGFSENSRNQSHQLPIGALLENQYVIGRVLGQGGFGITYIGWDENLNRRVAIKEYFPAGLVTRDVHKSYSVKCTADMDLFIRGRERFLKEAQALAKLQDMSEIAKVYNYFASNGTAYIVMEYVEGAELKAYVRHKGGKLTPEETFRILKPLMEALIKIHKAGTIHRDISPDNIMIKRNGQVVLLDFGTARDVDREKNPTQAILKPGFAPMEQYQSTGNLGPWTDEYALCATIYYCLTGHIPAEAPERLMDKVDINWHGIPGLNHYQISVLEKGMAFNVKDRYPSVAELYDALYQTKPKPGKGKKLLWILVAVVAVAVAALVAGKFLLPGEPEATVPTTVPVETTIPGTPPPHPTGGEEMGTLGTIAPKDQVGGTLRADTAWLSGDNDISHGPVFGSDILRREIYSVTFLNDLNYVPSGSWDVSADGSGTVLAWVVESDEDPAQMTEPPSDDEKEELEPPPEKLYELYIAANGKIEAPEDCRRLFMGYTSLKEVHFGGILQTGNVTSMANMFQDCWNLEELDFSGLDTSRVTDTSQMFYNCASLKRLNLEGMDTARVTDMSWMFKDCIGLEVLELSSFDTSSVTTMQSMFENCDSLKLLDLSNFDTAKVTDMSWMFNLCGSLESIVLDSFNTAKVKTMKRMFANCASLQDLNLSSFNTVNVTDMSAMFLGCKTLRELNVSYLNTVNVTDMYGMFKNCESLEKLDLSTFQTPNVTSMESMFSNCGALAELNLEGLDTSSVTNMGWMFSMCKSLEKLDVGSFNTSNVIGMNSMFNECNSLRSVNVEGFDTGKVTSMAWMFCECYVLEELNVSGFNTSNVTSVRGMFEGCGKLPIQNLSKWDLSKITTFDDFMDPGKKVKMKDGKKTYEVSWEQLFAGKS